MSYFPDFSHELDFYKNYGEGYVVGVDEVGRGAVAGPVLAAAFAFSSKINTDIINGVNDSKKLSKKNREKYFEQFQRLRKRKLCYFSYGMSSVAEIEKMNILQASLTAMSRALEEIKNDIHPQKIVGVLVDGNKLPHWRKDYPMISLKSGDSRSYSIAAASIVAKVCRDNLMSDLDLELNGRYLWGQNSGYGTKAHIKLIREKGISPHHRISFCLNKIFVE